MGFLRLPPLVRRVARTLARDGGLAMAADLDSETLRAGAVAWWGGWVATPPKGKRLRRNLKKFFEAPTSM